MQGKVIKEKIKSVGSIKKITKTMENVSAAKMKKAIDAAHALRPFHDEAVAILQDIALDPVTAHPLLSHNKDVHELLVIVASNKGLCGSYNTNIYRKVLELYGKDERQNVKVIAIGKFAEKIARRLSLEIIASFPNPHFTESDARVITRMLVDPYAEKKLGGVRILYTHFAKATSFIPVVKRLLPFMYTGEQEEVTALHGEPRFEYEPGINEVLSHVVPMMLENIIISSVYESYASEHSARMFAMKSATDNADELQKDLKLYYNRARQDAVTQEIAEITSGAMALTA